MKTIAKKLTTIGLLSLSVIATTACQKAEEQVVAEPKLRPVRSVVLEPLNNQRSHEFTAVVDASQKADLAFKVSGELAQLLVKQGDEVAKGHLIAKLDDTDFKIHVKEAKSAFETAKSDYDRAKSLIKTDYISQSDFDQLKAKYNSAQAQLESAENNLRYTELHASFDGIIAKTYTEQFQEIAAKEPIVRLHDLNQIKLLVDIPESIMVRIKKDGERGKVEAVFNSIPDKTFPLMFSEVSTVADEQTKTYQATFVMNAPQEHVILPGMTAVVQAHINLVDSQEPSFYLPANAVLKDEQSHYVFVVETVEQGKGKVVRKNITVGELTALGIEVFTGLTSGEAVITAGMTKITDGMMVKI